MEFGAGVQLGGAFGVSVGPCALVGLAVLAALGVFLGAEAVEHVKEAATPCPCSNPPWARPAVHAC